MSLFLSGHFISRNIVLEKKRKKNPNNLSTGLHLQQCYFYHRDPIVISFCWFFSDSQWNLVSLRKEIQSHSNKDFHQTHKVVHFKTALLVNDYISSTSICNNKEMEKDERFFSLFFCELNTQYNFVL